MPFIQAHAHTEVSVQEGSPMQLRRRKYPRRNAFGHFDLLRSAVVAATETNECTEMDESQTSRSWSTCTGEDNANVTIRTVSLNLVALSARNIFSIVEASARDFEVYKDKQVEEALRQGQTENLPVRVKINVEPSVNMPSMYDDIINDAKFGGGIFDGYFTNPVRNSVDRHTYSISYVSHAVLVVLTMSLCSPGYSRNSVNAKQARIAGLDTIRWS